MEPNKILENWLPSQSAVNVLKLNGVTNETIQDSVRFLKSQRNLKHIDDIEGYSNWNSFFIVFCTKAHKNKEKKARGEEIE